MKILLIIAVCLSVPLVPLSLLMRNYKLDQISRSRLTRGYTKENSANKCVAEDGSKKLEVRSSETVSRDELRQQCRLMVRRDIEICPKHITKRKRRRGPVVINKI